MSKPNVPPSDHGPETFTIINPEHRLLQIDFREIWRYRDLVAVLARRDMKAEFAQTILGPLWLVIHPVMQSVVFAIVFGRLAKIPTDGIPPFLFYNASLVMWIFCMHTANFVSTVITTNMGLFSKIYFPRLIVPMAVVLFRLVHLAVNYVLFLGFLAYFLYAGADVKPNAWILATPLLVLQTAILGTGIGLLAAAVTTRYRDIIQAFAYFMSFWMYATPIIYPTSQIPEQWRWFFYFNPITSVIDIFRHAHLGTSSVDLGMWAANALISMAVLCAGVIAFNHAEKTVADTI